MTVKVILGDGSQRVLNGRVGTIIDWMARHAEEIASYQTLKIEVDCGPDVVRFTRSPTEKITVQD